MRHILWRKPAKRHGPEPGAITGRAAALLDKIIAMNRQYKEITGRDAYLFTSQPGDGQIRVVFTDGVCHSWADGERHMRQRLAGVEGVHAP